MGAERSGAGKPAGKPGGKPSGRPAGKPSGKPSGTPGSKVGGKPAGKPGSKPGAKPSDRSTGKPGGKPGSKPGAKPSDRSTGKPGSKPGGKPAERSSSRPSGRAAGASADRRSERPGSQPRRDSRDAGERRAPSGRTSSGAKRSGPPRTAPSGPRDPHIPDSITLESLDPAVQNELRTLPEGLAEIVGRHLAAADEALVEDDVETARAHVAAARRRAGRVAAVREAAGVVAYLAGDYAEAIAELRAVRRMTGTPEYLPMMADCERGLGRPRRALELLKEIDLRSVDDATRVEVALVAAGARADLGQIDAALILLDAPDLTQLPAGGARARLEYARAELLIQAGREAEGRAWLQRAAESDVDGVTDAAERVEEWTGLAFAEEWDEDETPGV